MTELTRTENDAVIEHASLSITPDELEPGAIYGYRFRDRVEVVDLTSPKHTGEVDRKKGIVVVQDVASFAHYYEKHADEHSEIFAAIDDSQIDAVLDAHEPFGPRWQEHHLALQLEPTDQWRRWTARDGVYMSQREFAEFLEDNLVDIAPEPVDAATMLEVATSFQAKTRVSFSSGTVLASGDIRLNYQEETDATAGAKGQIVVPKRFAIGIAPYDDTEPYKIEARFRHRIEGGHLKLCFILDRPDDVLKDAFKTVVEKVESAVSVKVMRGRPA